MKREELEQLGLSKEVIDKVMELNGNDINNSKAQLETEKKRADNAEQQLKERDKDIADLKKSAGKDSELEAKLGELQGKYDNDTTAYKAQLEGLKRDHALDTALREAKVKNPKAVRGFLDLDKLKLDAEGKLSGLDLKSLKESDPYLFHEEEGAAGVKIYGTDPAGKPNTGTAEDVMQAKIADIFKEG